MVEIFEVTLSAFLRGAHSVSASWAEPTGPSRRRSAVLHVDLPPEKSAPIIDHRVVESIGRYAQCSLLFLFFRSLRFA